jgi:hypothetical protein
VDRLLHAVKQLQNQIEERLCTAAQRSDMESLEIHDDLEAKYSVVLILSPDQLQALVHDSNAVRFSGLGRVHRQPM